VDFIDFFAELLTVASKSFWAISVDVLI